MKHLIFFFKSLYSNKAALDGRKERWWMALICFILTLGLTTTPVLVKSYQVEGAQILTRTNNSSLDNALEYFSVNKKLPCKVSDEGKMVCNVETAKEIINSTVEDVKIKKGYSFGTYSQKREVTVEGIKTEKDVDILTVYYIPTLDPMATSSDNDLLVQFLNKNHFLEDKIKSGVMVFTSSTIYIQTYPIIDPTKDSNAVAQFNGEFSTIKGLDLMSFYENSNDLSNVSNKWQDLLTKTYETFKKAQIAYSVMFSLLISLIVLVIVTVVLFIVTRGKNNEYRSMNFWEAIKVTMFISVSPALIALILGFISPQFLSYGFMLAMGLRTMWIGMKTVTPSSPTGSSKNQPVYQARK